MFMCRSPARVLVDAPAAYRLGRRHLHRVEESPCDHCPEPYPAAVDHGGVARFPERDDLLLPVWQRL